MMGIGGARPGSAELTERMADGGAAGGRVERERARLALLALVLPLAGCGISERLEAIGKTPPLTPIENPVAVAGYQPVSLPMPDPEPAPTAGANSLWRSGARAFFKDQRAREVGDVVTVRVTMADRAELSNESTRARRNSEDLGINQMFGMAGKLGDLLSNESEDGDFVGLSSQSGSRGSGTVSRDEEIKLAVAAVVTQVLPNGNLVIRGRQEIRVNFEVRELVLAGVIRPQDVTSDNTIAHEKIAELRMAYGGRGQITDVQQPRYGQQALDILLPF
nr:flagellar basal body L-ring protein FlgH [Geminicoccus harenae]